jgi:dipeptidyl aminopeptidase/acylaminoacyl peptidase
LIKNSAPWIDPKRMRPTSILKYKTRDGRQLDAYVTMPAGATKQNPPPLVVLPQESPWSRATWHFDAEAQFLASRGYAVLRPNFRSSVGYTWMFPLEDEWAFEKLHDDVTAATRTLIASGLVDAARIGIVGTSFGGFLAVSGVANEPDLYRCAAAVSGVYDWARTIADEKYNKYSSPYFSRMSLKLGSPEQNPAKWEALAPLRRADRIHVPLLLVTGEYDAPVAVSEAKELASALSRNHVPVETLSFINEADGIAKLGHKLEYYTQLESFLAKYLTPGAAPTTPAKD